MIYFIGINLQVLSAGKQVEISNFFCGNFCSGDRIPARIETL